MSDPKEQALRAVEREMNNRLQEMAEMIFASDGHPLLSTLDERCATATNYFRTPLNSLARWLMESNENTNFTYPLTERGEQYTASAVSNITGIALGTIEKYLVELKQDRVLAEHIKHCSQEIANTDGLPHFGRRIGWYCFVRACKPSLVVETGVDKGLGSIVLCAALLKNAQEGAPGRYLGTDINPAAGQLLTGMYREVGTIAFGDSITTLQQLTAPIDLFINDSDHSEIYEYREYQTIIPRLRPTSILLGDNAHCTTQLRRFAIETNRRFLFIPEMPANHWYPGAGIGVAYT